MSIENPWRNKERRGIFVKALDLASDVMIVGGILKDKEIEKVADAAIDKFKKQPRGAFDILETAGNEIAASFLRRKGENEQNRIGIRNEAIKSAMESQAEAERLEALRKFSEEQREVKNRAPWQNEKIDQGAFSDIGTKYENAVRDKQRQKNAQTVDSVLSFVLEKIFK